MCFETETPKKITCQQEREIKVEDCIKYAIDNFSSEEATRRIIQFINDSLKLKEQEINLLNNINNGN